MISIVNLGDKFLIESEGIRNYEKKGWFVEASFLNIFKLEFIYGKIKHQKHDHKLFENRMEKSC